MKLARPSWNAPFLSSPPWSANHMGDRPRGIDGILVVAKEPGYTSQDVVAIVRRLTSTRRAGHGGTLDPFAAGVLPVFLGLGTRLVEYHMGDGKAYRATVCLGARSKTDDRDGTIEPSGTPAPTRDEFEAALAEFHGTVSQTPPAYSALKVAGRRAYDLAREGTPAELKPRTVTIARADLVSWDESEPGRPKAVIDVECSAGTYIRSIARDLGEKLGCGGYLGELTRSASGGFGLPQAHSLEEIRTASEAGPAALAKLILPLDSGLDSFSSVPLTDLESAAVAKGQQIRPAAEVEAEPGSLVRLLALDGHLLGMARWQGGRLQPEKILAFHSDDEPGTDTGASDKPAAPAVEPRLQTVASVRRMTALSGIAGLRRDLGRLYVAVGVFDGLHRGHLYLLRELRRAARSAGARPAVITFDAHPEEIVEGIAPPLLCDPEERLVRIAAAGIDVTVVQHFDHELRHTTYEGFVQLIRDRVELAGFAMTPDASFGYNRGGTPETLTELGAREGFAVTVVPAFLSNGEQLRSSDIRRRIAAGDLERARQLLGRPLGLTGCLGEPSAVGRTPLTFDLPVCLPPDGRYSVAVGSAWSVKVSHEPATTPATAALEGGAVTIETAGLPVGPARVVFLGRAD
jgi:tRNA pseudouridine55 synthase